MSVTDEIKERLDIVEVISQYVPLKKAGRNFQGLCPFHNEKTPSFVVFPESQGWHCFGACSTGGDLFTFVMKRENLDFGEALKLLAAKAGVELRPRAGAPSADEQRLERLRAIISDAAIYYNYLLNRAAEAAIARDYLAQRGLTAETWETWQLGYAADSWDALKDRLVAKGYALEEIEEAGLVIRREDGSGCYDRFRGRLMIPIRDAQGRTIGFGARLLRDDPDRPQPKYINSPQTPLFDKGSVLYGLDMARKPIRDADLAVIVEGYMDVLMSHQVGVCNVVAGMGTALTEAQMRQIKRYSSNITLALDPDVAGDQATLRGLETARQAMERDWEPVFSPTGLLRQEGRLKAQLRIAALPGGLDPDELARQDVAGWKQVIADALPVIDYYLALVSREEDLSSARGKDNAVARLAPLIREIASPIERSHYTQLLARMIQADERLVAQQIATRRAAERRTFRDARSRQDAETDQRGDTESETGERTTAERPVVAVRRSAAGLEEHILGRLLARPDLLAALDAELIRIHTPPLSIEDFAGAESQAVLTALQANPAPAGDWSAESVLAAMPEPLQDFGQALLDQAQAYPPLTEEKLIKDLGDALLRLRARNLDQQVRRLRFLILESQEAGSDEWRRYRELVQVYSTQMHHIARLAHSRTMTGALAQRTHP
jgi:DNA primase